MSILHRLRSDLQRSIAEHQVILLTEVLRQRFGELTLGDLREILTSPLGRGLDDLKLTDIAGARARTGAAPAAPAAGQDRQPSASSSQYVAAIVETLGAAEAGMTSGELRAEVGGSASTMYRAVTELIKAGRVQSEGKPARYSLTDREDELAAAEAANPRGPARRGRAPEVSARTLTGRAHYDAAVLNLLQQTNGWIGASQLRATVGGSDNQIRIALHRLVAAGQVVRRGERNSTEYRLGGRS